MNDVFYFIRRGFDCFHKWMSLVFLFACRNWISIWIFVPCTFGVHKNWKMIAVRINNVNIVYWVVLGKQVISLERLFVDYKFSAITIWNFHSIPLELSFVASNILATMINTVHKLKVETKKNSRSADCSALRLSGVSILSVNHFSKYGKLHKCVKIPRICLAKPIF